MSSSHRRQDLNRYSATIKTKLALLPTYPVQPGALLSSTLHRTKHLWPCQIARPIVTQMQHCCSLATLGAKVLRCHVGHGVRRQRHARYSGGKVPMPMADSLMEGGRRCETTTRRRAADAD